MKSCLKVLAFLFVCILFNTQVALAHSGSSSNCLWLETEKEAFKSKDAIYFLIPPIGLIAAVLFVADSIGCTIEKLHHPESSSAYSTQSPYEDRNQTRNEQTTPIRESP